MKGWKIIKGILGVLLFVSTVYTSFAFDMVYMSYPSGHMFGKNSFDTTNGTEICNMPGAYPDVSPDGLDIIYTNFAIYKKSASNTSCGISINSQQSDSASYSPNGSLIVYQRLGGGNVCWLKSSSDSSNWSAITSDECSRPKFSPDWLSIVYTNTTHSSFLYKKSSSDSSNWSAITSVNSGSPSFSKDGTKIIYRGLGWQLYSKNSSDALNWSSITSDNWGDAIFSGDGNSIIYTNLTDSWFRIYKKSASDSSNGSPITASGWQGSTVINSSVLCTNQIQDQDETGVDTGGVCGNQTCWFQELNYQYPAPYYTGSYSSNTRNYYNTGTIVTELGEYIEDITPPSSWAGYTFDTTTYRIGWANISNIALDGSSKTSSGTLQDLWNHDIVLRVPGYVQSPWDYLSSKFSYFEIDTKFPIDFFYITGSWVINGWLKTGRYPDGLSNDPNNTKASIQKVWEDGIGIPLFWTVDTPTYYTVGTIGAPIQHVIKRLISQSKDGTYKIRVSFPSTALDVSYNIKDFRVWHYADQFTQQYVCKNNDTWQVLTPGGTEVDPDTFCELNGECDTARAEAWSGWTLKGTFSLNFGTLPSVSSSFDCSSIYNLATGWFKYLGASSGSISLWMTNNFKISNTVWSCPILSSDICSVAYYWVNDVIDSVFQLNSYGINQILGPLSAKISYLWTPTNGSYYCFAGKNWQYTNRVTSYKDTKWVTHNLANDENTLFDLFVLAILSYFSITTLINFWRW